MRKYFGTDGVRGQVGQGYITVDFALKLGNAVGRVVARKNEHKKLVVIGQDTRCSGYFIKASLVAGLNAIGIDVLDMGEVPTPVVAYATQEHQAAVGFVITASHNHYKDNGIKIFSSHGLKLADAVELEIEDEIDKQFAYSDDFRFGKNIILENSTKSYVQHCLKKFSHQIQYRGKVFLDCANGATYKVARDIFDTIGVNYVAVGVSPDGNNINRECGSTYIQNLANLVLENNADLGISFDGDGDRIIAVDEKGNTIDGDMILYILASHPDVAGATTGVVGTLMTNMAFENKFSDENIGFIRAKVGDRYVMEQLNKNAGFNIGGESSGHIINTNHSTTGDGIITSLQLLAIFSKVAHSASFYYNSIPTMQQVMINVELANTIGADEMSLLYSDVADAEKLLGSRGRVLLRPSGTEPVLRVMVEAENKGLAQKNAEMLAKKVKIKLI